MRREDIDELLARRSAFDSLYGSALSSRLNNPRTQIEESIAKTLLQRRQELGNIPQAAIARMARQSEVEKLGLSSSVLREATRSRIDERFNSIQEMSFANSSRTEFLAKLGELRLPFAAHSAQANLWRVEDDRWRRTLGSNLFSQGDIKFIARETAATQYANAGALFDRFKATDFLSTSPSLAARLAEPILFHSRFTAATLARLSQTEDMHESTALRASLTLFNDQLSRLTTAISPMIVPLPAQRRRPKYPPSIELNLPTVQRDELLSQEGLPVESDYQTLATFAQSSSVPDIAAACVVLYQRCNDACRFNDEELIFTPTTRGMVAASRIGLIVADKQENFDCFIDQLYMLFYEGGGGQRIKLLTENGGVMERTECDALWDVKQLRSKRSRHDIEHGSEGDIKRKYRELRLMYERLGLNRFPQTPEEYKLLQLQILRNLRAFLNTLAVRLEERNIPDSDE